MAFYDRSTKEHMRSQEAEADLLSRALAAPPRPTRGLIAEPRHATEAERLARIEAASAYRAQLEEECGRLRAQIDEVMAVYMARMAERDRIQEACARVADSYPTQAAKGIAQRIRALDLREGQGAHGT
jgi:hypothetical protein